MIVFFQQRILYLMLESILIPDRYEISHVIKIEAVMFMDIVKPS